MVVNNYKLWFYAITIPVAVIMNSSQTSFQHSFFFLSLVQLDLLAFEKIIASPFRIKHISDLAMSQMT